MADSSTPTSVPADSPAPPVGLNPFDPGYFADPYTQFDGLRDHDPVHRTPFGPWLVTRWDDVHRLLREPQTSVEAHNSTNFDRREGPFGKLIAEGDPRAERGTKAILNIDPPDHTRLRRLVSKAFTPRTVERLRPRVSELVSELLESASARSAETGEPTDLITELAFPLPFQVISEMLGMPDGDRDQLREWSHTITQTLDPVLAMMHAEEILDASDHMQEVVSAAVAWKRGRPDDDDLLADLIRAEDDGDMLSDRELIDNVILLYLAGHETTVNLIGNGVLALLTNRAEYERLALDPDLDATATDELLRYDSPVQFSRRIMLREVEVQGQVIEAGEFVMTGLAAANRDPRKFGPDAHQLRLDRADANQHVSFGSGVHHCLGAALARLEGRLTFGALARRFPATELATDTPDWNGRIILRGLDHLPVSLA